VTEPAVRSDTRPAGRAIVGVLLALAGHALAFGAGFLAARLVKPSSGGGFEDLAAVIMVFLGVEVLVALACIIVGIVLIVRGRRATGVGLIAGWALGLVASVITIQILGA
jgi:hypothetical protein